SAPAKATSRGKGLLTKDGVEFAVKTRSQLNTSLVMMMKSLRNLMKLMRIRMSEKDDEVTMKPGVVSENAKNFTMADEVNQKSLKKLLLAHLLHLSSVVFTNQFLSEHADVNISEILKDSVKFEVQSIVDVPVKQATPAALIHPLVDSTVTLARLKQVDLSKDVHDVGKIKLEKAAKLKIPKPATPETPDPDWSKDPKADTGPEQNLFSKLEKITKAPEDFDDYHIKKDTLTKADLESPVFELFKGTCRSSIEIEYHLDQHYFAFSDKPDWKNPKGDIIHQDYYTFQLKSSSAKILNT
nr:hypothetical protein [Tanacetum cinerariifolium]